MKPVTAFKGVFTNVYVCNALCGIMQMNTYEAMVRIQSSNMVIRTRVHANSNQDALWLLEGQYGVGNVVTLPLLVDD